MCALAETKSGWPGIIDAYRAFLPVTDATPRVTLLEGDTPLLRLRRLESRFGFGGELYAKWEGGNPTGSFKDRGMTLAVSKAKEAGAIAVMCGSTGNTSASAAAYAARSGLKAVVLVPDGYVALGKLSQTLLFGAQVIAVRGSFDDALRLVRELTQKHPITLVNSVNPHRIEGQKTAAFEIVDRLGDAPDILAIPVGNAGNITAYWRGFAEYHEAGHATRRPRLFGFQAAGAAPIVAGAPVAKPETIATAIRIGNPASWQAAVAARDESGGAIEAVSDAEILDAYRELARYEGVFCEPASAASVAGVARLARAGRLDGVERIVCVLTGNGLKDPDRAIAEAARPQVVDPTLAAVERVMADA